MIETRNMEADSIDTGAYDDDNNDNDNNDLYSFDDDYMDMEEIPLCCRHDRFKVCSARIFPHAEAVITDVLAGKSALRLLEGTRAIYTDHHVCFNGECSPLPTPREKYSFVGALLCDSRTITSSTLREAILGSSDSIEQSSIKSSSFTRLLTTLIRSGLYYPVDVDT